MLRKLHLSLFFLLILTLPINLAKHFIFPFSYVGGVLVDYLIPSVYLTDLVVLAIFLIWDLDLIINRPKYKFSTKVLGLFSSILLFIFLLVFSVNSNPGIYKFVKYLEMAILFFYTGLNFSFRRHFSTLVTLISLSVIFESFLGLSQWIKRGSVFSNYLFFGEQPYSYKTLGIAREGLFDVSTLPPYGTFPHPNVFGGFLVLSLTIIFYYMLKRGFRTLDVCAFFFGLVVLALTLSTSAYLALMFAFIAFFLFKIDRSHSAQVLIVFLVLLNLVLPTVFKSKSLEDRASVFRRSDLIDASLKMVKSKPFFGLGVNFFTVELEKFGGVRGMVRFIQPVHNIFLLILAESGIFVFGAFCLFLYFFISAVAKKSVTSLPLVLLFEALFLGTFDHYLFTIQQGLLLFWLTLGLGLSTIVIHESTPVRSKA